MSDAELAQQFQLDIGDAGDSPAAMTEIKEIKNFTGFDGQANEIDVTHLQSTAKEFKLGLKDAGSFNVDFNYINDDPGQVEARAANVAGTEKLFLATFSSGVTASFAGYVQNAPMTGAVDDVVNSSFTIRITGAITWA